jgi:hypothetical protein|tara:strand:- start:6752 stop:6898 length:147 start_codon:yes stop_codon:yes gene_type:complete
VRILTQVTYVYPFFGAATAEDIVQVMQKIEHSGVTDSHCRLILAARDG